MCDHNATKIEGVYNDTIIQKILKLLYSPSRELVPVFGLVLGKIGFRDRSFLDFHFFILLISVVAPQAAALQLQLAQYAHHMKQKGKLLIGSNQNITFKGVRNM